MDFAAFNARGLSFLARACAALCMLALAVLSWTPGAYMIRTGVLPGQAEHFLAYLFSGCSVAAAFTKIPYARIACTLCCYAGLLEIGQFAVPGRHPAFADFSASSLGVLVGIALIATIARRASHNLGLFRKSAGGHVPKNWSPAESHRQSPRSS